MPIVRQVVRNIISAGGVVHELGASFLMDGSVLHSAYRHEGLQRMFEQEGIVPKGGGESVFPRDGRRFYDALPAAFRQSSSLSVIDVEQELD